MAEEDVVVVEKESTEEKIEEKEPKNVKKVNKKEKNKEKSTSNTDYSSKILSSKILSCLGFFASALIAISLILQLCFKDVGIVKSTRMVGEGIAYIISILLGFSFVKKKKIGWIIAWTVFAVIIVVFFFLR